MQFSGQTSSLITLGVIVVVAIILIVVVVPLFTRFGLVFEAMSLLLEGLGEYFGHPRLVWLGCLVAALMACGCCAVIVIVTGSLLSCNAANPAQLCRLIGR